MSANRSDVILLYRLMVVRVGEDIVPDERCQCQMSVRRRDAMYLEPVRDVVVVRMASDTGVVLWG